MMACLKKLKTDGLNGAQASGGSWFYRLATSITVTITGQGTVALDQGDMVPGGDDPELDISTIVGLSPGTHTNAFEYQEEAAGGCAGSFVTLYLYDAPCSGTAPGTTVEVCIGDAAINLYDQLANCAGGDTPSTNGNWSVITGDPVGFSLSADNNGANDSFNPSAPGVVAETKTVRYTIPDPTNGQAGAGCTNCGEQTTDYDIIVNDAFNAGSNGSINGCI